MCMYLSSQNKSWENFFNSEIEKSQRCFRLGLWKDNSCLRNFNFFFSFVFIFNDFHSIFYVISIKIHFLRTLSSYFRWFVNKIRRYENYMIRENTQKFAIIIFFNVMKFYNMLCVWRKNLLFDKQLSFNLLIVNFLQLHEKVNTE